MTNRHSPSGGSPLLNLSILLLAGFIAAVVICLIGSGNAPVSESLTAAPSSRVRREDSADEAQANDSVQEDDTVYVDEADCISEKMCLEGDDTEICTCEYICYVDSTEAQCTGTVGEDGKIQGRSSAAGKKNVKMSKREAQAKGREHLLTQNAKDQINSEISDLNGKISKYMKRYKLNDYVLADLKEQFSSEGKKMFGLESNSVSKQTQEVWDSLNATDSIDCSYDSDNKQVGVSSRLMYYMYPIDQIYNANFNIDELFDGYQRFFTNMYQASQGARKHYIAAYTANNIKHMELKQSKTVSANMQKLSPFGMNALVQWKNNEAKVRFVQPKLKNVFRRFEAITKRINNQVIQSDGSADHCFNVMIIHTFPADFANYAKGSDMQPYYQYCHTVPVVIMNNELEKYFDSLIALIDGSLVSTMFATAEAGLKGYYKYEANNVQSQNQINRWFDNVGTKMLSYMCTVENNKYCLLCHAYAPVEESMTSTTESTTTAWSTTTFTSATETTEGSTTEPWSTTEGWSTSAGQDRFLTSEILEDQRCCGLTALGAPYDRNTGSCCVTSDNEWKTCEA